MERALRGSGSPAPSPPEPQPGQRSLSALPARSHTRPPLSSPGTERSDRGGGSARRAIPALGSLRGLGKPLNLSASVSPSAKVGGIQFYLTGLL